ncbi:hypothetical protein [Methylobacterium indicum]|uniref:Tail assembly chaperone n=1 Tax=Methylobacterium indicum TaxID=1775910 RepID=A0A8H8X218_9HYPH|nr:hypothetical protein [Methylobacterium indicum]BCM88092.1 hypothetical protein mvi_65530 [Methylobacterium indicum]
MDLGKFDVIADAERGAAVHLRNPYTQAPLSADDGSPVEILVKGADAAAFRRAQRDAQNRVAQRPSPRRPLTFEEAEVYSSRLLAAVTIGWRNIVVDGETWEFNEAAAVALYERFEWIRTQVDEGVNDRRRFAPEATRV